MKLNKREWWLLSAPLLVIGALTAVNYVPSVKQAWDDWRLYGNQRPLFVLRPPHSKEKRSTFEITFSHDTQWIARSYWVYSDDDRYRTQVVSVWNTRTGNSKTWANGQWLNEMTFIPDTPYIQAELLTSSEDKKRAEFNYLTGAMRPGSLLPLDEKERRNRTEFLNLYGDHNWTWEPAMKRGVKNEKGQTRWFKSADGLQTLQVEKVFAQAKNVGQAHEKIYDFRVDVKFTDKSTSEKRIKFSVAKHQTFYSSSLDAWYGDNIDIYTSSNCKRLLIQTEDPFINGYSEGAPEIRTLQLWDTSTGKLLQETKRSSRTKGEIVQSFESAAFSPDNKLLAIRLGNPGGYPCITELRDAATGAVLKKFTSAQNQTAYKPVFSRDSRRLFVPCRDRIEVWDVSDIKP
jgi:WD40 repeat protein